MGLDVPEQQKVNHKLLLKHILRQFNSEGVEGNYDGGSSWYAKLHNHIRGSCSKKAMHLSVSNKNLNLVKTACLIVTSFLRILLGETRYVCW